MIQVIKTNHQKKVKRRKLTIRTLQCLKYTELICLLSYSLKFLLQMNIISGLDFSSICPGFTPKSAEKTLNLKPYHAADNYLISESRHNRLTKSNAPLRVLRFHEKEGINAFLKFQPNIHLC